MIDLYTAFKLCDISDDEIIHFRRKNQIFKSEYEILTGKQVRNKYDMRKTKVINITSYFLCGDYEGFLFTIK